MVPMPGNAEKMDQKPGDYRDHITAQLEAIGARLDSIFVTLKKDVEAIKARVNGTPSTPVQSSLATDHITSINPTGSEHEDEDLVKGTVPTASTVSASAPPPASATPLPTIINPPPNHTGTYIPPRLTAPSNESLPSSRIIGPCLLSKEKDVIWAQLVNQIQIESGLRYKQAEAEKKSGTESYILVTEKQDMEVGLYFSSGLGGTDPNRTADLFRRALVTRKNLHGRLTRQSSISSQLSDLRTSRFPGQDVLIRTQG